MTPRTLGRLLRAVALTLGASAWLCPSVSAQVRTVVTIYWSAEDFPSTPMVDAAIRGALRSQSDVPVDYFTEHLESDRFEPDVASASLRDYIRQKYHGRRIDLVIAMADPALQFVLQNRDELFPGAPIVFSGLVITDAMRRGVGDALTGVLRGVAYGQTLRLALDLHPSIEQVFVVAKAPQNLIAERVQAELREFSRQVTLRYLNEPTISDLLDVVSGIPPRSLVLFIRHSQEDPGNQVYADEVASRVAAASPVPVYVTNERFIGQGVVGGVVHLTRETGVRIGQMALQVLKGTRPQDIPIEAARLAPTFDWRQIQRWGIDTSRIPSGAQIRFRVPTAWESYRNYIIVTAMVIAVQLMLIAALLTHRAQRRGAESALLEREATLRSSYERIRLLAGRLINAQEEARADIARDLHDDLGQELAGVSMAVSCLKRSSGNLQDAQTQHALSTLHQHTLGMADQVRNLSHELHPATLRLVGLAGALGGHCVEVEKRHEVQVSFTMGGDLGDIPNDIALCLFRIAQEALRNGAVHGRARRLAVSLAKFKDSIELRINDDGRGFDLEAVRREGTGLGLVSIEERAHVLGGDVHIVTRPENGTRIRVRIPMSATAHGEKENVRVHVRVLAPQHLSKTTEQL
jgi:signal transduction histidine kinase